MERIKTAISRHDHLSLRHEAHSLKSSIAIVGAGEAASLAEKLELAGKTADLSEVDKLYSDLNTRIEKLMRAMKRDHLRGDDRIG